MKADGSSCKAGPRSSEKTANSDYAQKFDNEKRQGTLAALFAGLTIFISCLGLFRLATNMAENRLKEIGVRKVLGASITGITTSLSKDFVKLVIISFVIAAPLSYWAMYRWLLDYEYRVSIEWWGIRGCLFLISGDCNNNCKLPGYQSGISKPGESLRTE